MHARIVAGGGCGHDQEHRRGRDVRASQRQVDPDVHGERDRRAGAATRGTHCDTLIVCSARARASSPQRRHSGVLTGHLEGARGYSPGTHGEHMGYPGTWGMLHGYSVLMYGGAGADGCGQRQRHRRARAGDQRLWVPRRAGHHQPDLDATLCSRWAPCRESGVGLRRIVRHARRIIISTRTKQLSPSSFVSVVCADVA
jgi:hypothetical protein